MDTAKILREIEGEIVRLQTAASVLRGLGRNSSGTGRRATRRLSAAARKRISDAQKKRWAKARTAK
jgi:hypothetical protein